MTNTNELSTSSINAVADLKPGYTLGAADVALLQEMARRLLAVEGQEPVADIYAELYRLREETKGPDGFATWKDAALAEKKARIKCESYISKSSQDIDYLTAMASFHSDDWHKMSPITAYMHGWNARKAIDPDSDITRDALRYRFLRDKDAFGADNEPGLAAWDDLVEMELNVFDAAVDARMAHADIAPIPLYAAPQPAPVAQPVQVPDDKHLRALFDAWFASDCSFDRSPDATEEDNIAWRESYWYVWQRCRAAMLKAEPVSKPYKLPDGLPPMEHLDIIKFNADCAMENPDSIYANEFFLSLDEIFGEKGNYSLPVQAKAISVLIAEIFRIHGYKSAPQEPAKCWCHTCRPVTMTDMRFVVCPECGNKRCPHANDHRNACSGSNKPGQEGSAYPEQQEPTK